MSISVGESLLIIAVCAVCTFAERLPPAVMATLVVYCLRSTDFSAAAGFLPQLISVAVTVALHLLRRNTMLSVVVGTACYMLLVQLVF